MMIAQLPTDEELRLKDLKSNKILDTPFEKEFDELVELASYICNCPVSLFTLLDKDRQWFKARKGISITETSREHALCCHTILQDQVMVVEDTHTDERFDGNPLVYGDLNIRFYAGVPIISPMGYKLGSLCVIDNKPRKLSGSQIRSLIILANQLTTLLEMKRQNRVMNKRAKQLLKLKDTTITLAIEDNDTVKETIAIELHENLAQTIAASRVYLQMAIQNESKRLTYINQSSQYLGEILHRIRKFSNILTPAALQTLPFETLAIELIEKCEADFSFQIEKKFIGIIPKMDASIKLTCIRIIENWLEVLHKDQQASLVSVTFILTDIITIQFDDNGKSKDHIALERELVTSRLHGRLKMVSGSLSYNPGNNKNSLFIRLPFEASKNSCFEEKTATISSEQSYFQLPGHGL